MSAPLPPFVPPASPWPGLVVPWRAGIVHLDDDVVVVDKPVGMSTHAPEEGRTDDVLSRVAAHLAARGAGTYLGIHHRLDKDTSGVLLLARRREANKSLAEQFEGRRVTKRYVAVVEGRVPDRAELRHFVRKGDGERREARVARGAPKRDEQEAVTRLETLDRRTGRALVALEPVTGRTHQLRVQLAALGAPIVGDPIYDGAPATRLMLHARSLSLKHPTSGAPLHLEAPVPDALDRALRRTAPTSWHGDRARIAAIVREAADRRYGVLAGGDTDACRLVHGEGDGLPGVSIDLYGAWAVVSLYEELDEATQAALFDALIDVGARGVYAKYRPKNASRIVDSRRVDVAPSAPVRGEAAPDPLSIREHGVPFEARLGDGLSTGLFLDQREVRRRLGAEAKGARVLNLFAYTGGFSVVTAAGGAQSTTTVDVSRTVLATAEKNLAHLGFGPPAHAVVEADVFAFLEHRKKAGEKWDLVVLDPPSFSTTKRSRFSAEDDYARLAALALAVVAPGGRLLACTNHRGVPMVKLRRKLHDAARTAQRHVAQMKNLPPPVDFPPPPGAEPHLKCVLVTVT